MIDERALIADVLAKFEKYVYVYHTYLTVVMPLNLLGINKARMLYNSSFFTRFSALPTSIIY